MADADPQTPRANRHGTHRAPLMEQTGSLFNAPTILQPEWLPKVKALRAEFKDTGTTETKVHRSEALVRVIEAEIVRLGPNFDRAIALVLAYELAAQERRWIGIEQVTDQALMDTVCSMRKNFD